MNSIDKYPYRDILKYLRIFQCCFACFNGKPSSTGNTIRFAKENGCKIRIVNPDDYK